MFFADNFKSVLYPWYLIAVSDVLYPKVALVEVPKDISILLFKVKPPTVILFVVVLPLSVISSRVNAGGV